jgi:putative heme-binding domain-containing protein
LNSIVKHKHQMAAYCGLTYFDSEAYPEEYREVLYMGNIHGGCINADKLERQGSSYFATPRNDLLTANDAWFMPVSQKTGPDGCLYILDWYDRYHCYQDARRDPAGIDRERGRIYRLRYKETPRASQFDLATDSDEVLLKHLGNPNIYFRENAQRLLIERLSNARSPGIRPKIEAIVLDEKSNHKARMHALWVLVSSGPLPEIFHLRLLSHEDPLLRSWGVRSAGNMHQISQEIRTKLKGMVNDSSKDVLLQLAIAAKKITAIDAPKLLSDVLANADKDMVIASIVWQNLQPLLESANVAETFLKTAEANPSSQAEAMLLGKFAERMLAGKVSTEINASLLSLLIKDGHHDAAKQVILMMSAKVQSGDLKGGDLATLRSGLTPVLAKASSWIETKILKASWNDTDAIVEINKVLENTKADESSRILAFEALVATNPATALNTAKVIITDKNALIGLRGNLISALGKLQDPAIADMVIEIYPTLDPNIQPRAIELLSQRNTWANKLLDAMAAKKIPTTAMGTNQARKMMAEKDPALKKKLLEVWGAVREGRDPARESVITAMRALIIATPGDPKAGRLVFNKVCGQCHKMHGEGQEVGPDITLNGRANFEQLLSNVLDPSLVIGADYQATSVVTTKGRLLTGLMVEDSTTKISLKVQGGKVEVIPRSEVEEVSRSKNSLMPEGLEKQITPKEMADLFGYLILDKPPEDPKAKKIPGAP